MTRHAVALALLLAAAPAATAQAVDGNAIFDANCKLCHGATGIPSASIRKMFPRIPTFDAALFASRTDADLVKQVTEGKDKMKPFKDKLTADEIAAVVRYIRTLGK